MQLPMLRIQTLGGITSQPLLTLIENEMATLIQGMTVVGGYYFDYGNVNLEDRALEDNSLYNAYAVVYFVEENNQDTESMNLSDRYSNQANFTIEVRTIMDNESSNPKFDSRLELHKVNDDFKRLFGNETNLDRYYISKIMYTGSSRSDKGILRGDRFTSIYYNLNYSVWYDQARKNPLLTVT